RHRSGKAAPRDADDCQRLAVDADDGAEEGRIGAVTGPYVMTHDGDGRLVTPLLREREASPSSERHAEGLEVVCGDEGCLFPTRDAVFLDARVGDGECGDAR